MSPPLRQPPRPLDVRARHQLESLIRKHGPPTPASSTSSLRKLTSTSPKSHRHLDSPPTSPVAIESSYVTTSGTQPIPIPRPVGARNDLPVTPLTGRFNSDNPFIRADQSYRSGKTKKPTELKPCRPSRSGSRPEDLGRRPKDHAAHSYSFTETFPMSHFPMSQSGHSRPPQASSKPAPFHPGNLPRFHPAVYQPPGSHRTTHQSRVSPPPPQQQQQQPRTPTYRAASGTRDALRQYGDLFADILPRSSWGTKPSSPRLDPLGSPGPVTPLTLEEADGYLAAGSADATGSDKIPSPALERLEKVSRDKERVFSHKKDAKGR